MKPTSIGVAGDRRMSPAPGAQLCERGGQGLLQVGTQVLHGLQADGKAHHGAAAQLGRGAAAHGRQLIGHYRSEEHTSELQSLTNLVCRLLLEKKKKKKTEAARKTTRNKRE